MPVLDQPVIIVIPCYNEERRLPAPRLLEFLEQGPAGIGFLLVDHGSSDGTLALLQSLAALSLGHNQGKGEAVRRDILAALEAAPQAVGFWDADLAAPLEEIPALLEVLRQRPAVEMVLGARVQMLGRQISRRAWRHYLGRVSASLISPLLGLPLYDSQCGAKLFRANPRLAQIFGRRFQARWLFDVEVILR